MIIVKEEEEVVEETVISCGIDKVSILSVTSSCGVVSVLSLSSYYFIVSSSKPTHSSLHISFGAHRIVFPPKR